MNRYKIYSVYDVKGEMWGMPLFYDCRANALRSFTKAVNQKEGDNQIAEFPGDFSFFEIGEYDRQDGICVMYESKVNLGLGIEFKEKGV